MTDGETEAGPNPGTYTFRIKEKQVIEAQRD